MEIIDQSFEIITFTQNPLQIIEQAGRTCYKSESKSSPSSAQDFCQRILRLKHESVLEHALITVKFITDRGVSHELVRHRLASFSQESTRYCNYAKAHIQFIRPVWVCDSVLGVHDHFYRATADDATNDWLNTLFNLERIYKQLIERDWPPEKARSVLPNSLKTEIVVTANVREWRHIFELRTSQQAHPQIRVLMLACLIELKKLIPVVFDDILGTIGGKDGSKTT